MRVDLAKPDDHQATSVIFQDGGGRINSSASGARVGDSLMVSPIFGAPAVVQLNERPRT